MDDHVKQEVKQVICHTISTHLTAEDMPDDFGLAGENLDSMAVANLIVALEDHFGFQFEDDDLSAEAFETVASLCELVGQKLNGFHG